MNPYNYLSKYVLRTPLLDFNFFENLTTSEIITNERLQKAYDNPIVREALFLASPTLYFEIEKWISGNLETKKENKMRYSLLKYLTRMSIRCTPFGLFAGCGLGSFSDETSMLNNHPTKNKRHTRLDMNYLVALSQNLAQKQDINKQLLYFPNSSIYSSSTTLRYIEYKYLESNRQYQIVEVDNNFYLQEVLKACKNGSYPQDLINLIARDDITVEEAAGFIQELIEGQVLVSELEPSVSGQEFMPQILSALEKLNGVESEVLSLNKTKELLNELDDEIGNDTQKYIEIEHILKKDNTSFQLSYLFQADMELRPIENFLAHSVANSVKKGMDLLNRISPVGIESNLNSFRQAFVERYEEREISLSRALDVERGIGYLQNRGSGDLNPLVDDIVLPNKEDVYRRSKLDTNKIFEILSEKLVLCDKSNSLKIELKDSDFAEFPTNWKDLPDTMSAMIELVNVDRETKVKFSGLGGSSAINLLGRFCHGNPALLEHARNIAELERKMNPNAVLAEIVHLPEARVGNILMRPSFRDYEIPYLAKSNLKTENQIPIDDLYISVKKGRICLRSKRLNREILPRLSNAHNFSFNSLPIYHFLCDLQQVNARGGLYFSFGYLSKNRDFLPRVEFNNLILSSAQWKFKNKDFEPLLMQIEDVDNLKTEVAKLRERFRLPQYVLLGEGDNELLINFENITSIQMLLDSIKRKSVFFLSEFLFAEKGIVKSSSGYFTNQLILSFFNENKLLHNKPKYDV